MIILVLAIVVAAAAGRNETYCGRAGRGSFRCRGRGRTKTCWADETCKSNATRTRATPGERLWMTRVMGMEPFAVVVERDGWRRTDPIYVRGALDAPGLVFVKSERPILEKFLDDVLPGFQHPFVLYTGNADLTIPLTVAADAHYFVGGMGISTFDRGVVDMRSTRDQFRAAPATPANCTFMVRRHRGQEPSLRHFTSFP